MKNLKLFYLFSKYAFKSTTQQPVGSLFFLIGKIMRFGVYFVFVYYLLTNTMLLAGYNLNQTLIFFLTFSIIDAIAQMLFREVYRFRPLVVNAELDAILIKPYHPFMRILVGGVDLLDLVTIVFYLGLLCFYVIQLGSIVPLNIFIFLLLVINGLIIATAFHIIVLALGILTTEVDHAIMIYRDVTRLGTLPIDIYQEPFRSLFTFFLPIGVMMTFPVKSLFGLLSGSVIALSFVIGLLLLGFSLYLWNKALKKYQSWGG
ncbi:ABC-2 family transporter protein [Candidatus Roizmanbacteria bacterium]|nr:ABC-2 family transporter protein [Candidatus Roizmanbacteria bacterium]